MEEKLPSTAPTRNNSTKVIKINERMLRPSDFPNSVRGEDLCSGYADFEMTEITGKIVKLKYSKCSLKISVF